MKTPIIVTTPEADSLMRAFLLIHGWHAVRTESMGRSRPGRVSYKPDNISSELLRNEFLSWAAHNGVALDTRVLFSE